MLSSDPTMLNGEIVYFYACDMAYELRRSELNLLMGHPLVPHQIGPAKRSPRQQLFYVPRIVRLEPVTLKVPHGEVQLQRIVKVLPIGAVSITLRFSFSVPNLEALVALHQPIFDQGILHQQAKALAEELRIELEPLAIRPVPKLQGRRRPTRYFVLRLRLKRLRKGRLTAKRGSKSNAK